MDRFSISLQGYHELSQVDPSLPRAHLIEGCAKNVDSQWNITKTPGLSSLQLKSGGELQKVKVKLSGDGVKMSHSNNLLVCSFALLDIDGQNILSSAGMICIFNTWAFRFITPKFEYQYNQVFLCFFKIFTQLTIQSHLRWERRTIRPWGFSLYRRCFSCTTDNSWKYYLSFFLKKKVTQKKSRRNFIFSLC